MTFVELTRLSDAELLASMSGLVVAKGRDDAHFVAQLAETEQRRLHLEAGFSSLFDYCLRALGLSENEAFHRITAARLTRRFPQLLELLYARTVTLSAACLLRDYLTEENHVELLAAATHKSKRELEVYLAARFPAETRRSSVRKLPQRMVAKIAKPLAIDSGAALGRSSESKGTEPTHVDVEDATTASVALGCVSPLETKPATANVAASTEVDHAGVRGVAIEKAAPDPLFRVRFDASAELKAKLETANALLSHANPKGDFAVTIERALDALIDRLEKERWAKTSRPRVGAGSTSSDGAQSTMWATPKVTPARLSVSEDLRKRKRIRNEVRRVVVARDAGCCSFVSETGQRCGARAFLQLHHEQPWARGGADSSENLRLLCAAHNRLMAERDFGQKHMAHALGRTPAHMRSP